MIPIIGRTIRCIVIGMIVGVASLTLASPASAHANLDRSDPAAGALLTQTPASVTMIFTEPPDPELSAVEIFNAAGQQVQSGPATAGTAPRSLEVDLPADLPDGIYTVSWQVISEADGHWRADAFAFGVGVDPGTSVAPSVEAPTTPSPSSLSLVSKIALYVGIVLAIGVAVVGLWIMPGGVPARRILCGGVGVAAMAGAVGIVLAERSTVGVSLIDLLSSSTGRNYVWLLGTAGVLLACSLAAALTVGRETLALVGLTAIGAALARATGGHAAGASPAWPQELAQTVHIAAIGVWIGGFVPILLLLRSRSGRHAEGTDSDSRDVGPPVVEVSRFSRSAGWAVLVVVLTGAFRAVGEAGGIGAVRELVFDTSYGTTLIVKVALVAALIGLGSLNRRRSIPRLSTDGRMLSRVLTVEAAGAVIVLAATALLTGLDPDPPAPPSRPVAASINADGADFATTTRVRLTATPGTAGPNAFDVRVTDYDTGQDVVATGVSLSFEPVGRQEIASQSLELRQSGSGAWVGQGTPLSLAGVWNVTALVEIGARGVEVPMTLVTAIAGGQQVNVLDQTDAPDIVTISLAGGLQIQSYVDPGTAGPNHVHLTAFDAQGGELPLSDLLVIVTPNGGEPQALDATRLSPGSPGHFSAPADLDAGDWRVDVVATGQDGSVLQGWFDQAIGET